MAAGLAIAIGAVVLHGSASPSAENNALRFAAEMVFRGALAAYLLFYLARPSGWLLPARVAMFFARERRGFAFSFVSIYTVFLGCALAANVLSASSSLPTIVLTALSALVLASIVAGEWSGRIQSSHWRTALRAGESIAVAFFWLVYVADAFAHLAGSQSPDRYHAAALAALVLALIVRIAGGNVAAGH